VTTCVMAFCECLTIQAGSPPPLDVRLLIPGESRTPTCAPRLAVASRELGTATVAGYGQPFCRLTIRNGASLRALVAAQAPTDPCASGRAPRRRTATWSRLTPSRACFRGEPCADAGRSAAERPSAIHNRHPSPKTVYLSDLPVQAAAGQVATSKTSATSRCHSRLRSAG